MASKRIPKKVRANIQDYLETLRVRGGIPILQAFLFGSHAQGTARADSDIDLCVISPAFRRMKDPLAFLWTQRERRHLGIEPIGFAPEEFTNEDPLAHEIQTSGIRVR